LLILVNVLVSHAYDELRFDLTPSFDTIIGIKINELIDIYLYNSIEDVVVILQILRLDLEVTASTLGIIVLIGTIEDNHII
jgi:hypothetical protein